MIPDTNQAATGKSAVLFTKWIIELRQIKASIEKGIEQGVSYCDQEMLAFYEEKEKQLLKDIHEELQNKGIFLSPAQLEEKITILFGRHV